LLHQHQREVKSVTNRGKVIEYIEVIPSDIATANQLADLVLGRSLHEVPPHTRKLLLQLDELVTAMCDEQRCDLWLTRKTIRERTGWGNTQLKVHLQRLVELEYLLPHREGAGYAYELLFDARGKDGAWSTAGEEEGENET
ncbi:MAG: DNA primase, partial [Thaumarchaeota archaeon]|nr:DNA primase [Nitrososphaerota archaeon]